jgi:hypothetical protein
MPLSEQTRLELRAFRDGIELPSEYIQFTISNKISNTMFGWLC